MYVGFGRQLDNVFVQLEQLYKIEYVFILIINR